MRDRLARISAMRRIAELLGGQDALADALCIEPRSLRKKLGADRGISDAEIRIACDALDQRAVAIARAADRFRELIA